MKLLPTALILMFLILGMYPSRTFAEEGTCNRILSGDFAAQSLHDLARLRFDLDQRRAAGLNDAVTRALEAEYAKKESEVFAWGATREQVTAEIRKIQGEANVRETETARRRKVEAREIEAIRREMQVFNALKESRAWHAQSALPNGNLLVTGGRTAPGVPLSSIELVNLKKKTAVSIGSFLDQRTDYAQTALADGRVLVSGGLFRDRDPISSVEIIDPRRKTVKKIGDLKNRRSLHRQILLPDGRVLILPGGGAHPTQIEIVDVKQGMIEPFGRLKFRLNDSEAALLSDGRVMIVGKHDGSKSLFVEVFDPATQISQNLGKIAGIHPRATLQILPDGTILACGGEDGRMASSDVVVWNPFQKTLKKIGDLNEPKVDMTSSLLSDGRVFLSGGADSEAHTVTSLEIVDPGKGTVDKIGDLPTPMWLYSQTPLSNGQVAISGGYDDYGQKRSVILIQVGRR